ncbi:hypothetical protein [Actinomadura sp. 21ATH]
MPGKVADFLRTLDLDAAERTALDSAPAQRKARREYENRVNALAPA